MTTARIFEFNRRRCDTPLEASYRVTGDDIELGEVRDPSGNDPNLDDYEIADLRLDIESAVGVGAG